MSELFTADATSRFAELVEAGAPLRVHYHDCNLGGAQGTVVMLHGSGPGASGWSNFHRNILPLTAAGYRVILLDCPGWSASDPIVCPGSRSDLNARVVNQLMLSLGLTKIHLIGNSMGGHSAVAFALEHPDKIGRLILMGGGTGGVSAFAPLPTEGIKLLQEVYRNPTRDNFRRMMNVFVFDPATLTDELLEARLQSILDRPRHLENFLNSLALNPRQFPDVGHRLHEIRAPTLIVWGRNDRFVPFDIGIRLLAGIAGSELHLFNQCGHWVQWEHAQSFNALVAGFLNR